MTHVLLVDDLPEALAMMARAVREAFPDAYCTRANGVAQALAAIGQTRFDLALIDLGLNDGTGRDVIAHLAQVQPGCALVVATIYGDDEHLFTALQAGAQGYVLKDQSPAWLARQLQGIASGQPPLSPAIARRLLRHFQHVPLQSAGAQTVTTTGKGTIAAASAELSPRERAVLSHLAQGVQISDIATVLGISRHTVGDHVKNIYRKLNISSRAQAALRARGLGLI